MTLVLLVRHGLTAGTGRVLTGRAPGISLDDRGRRQAAALAQRLAGLPLDAIVTSPLERCRETADAVAAARDGNPATVHTDAGLIEVGYGDWTGRALAELTKEPLWPVVQAHPSSVRFPGDGGESMAGMAHRAVSTVRSWNERLGPRAVYVICSHGDVIKSVIADGLGLHLDLCQRIQVDPCSLTAIRYTPVRPFVLTMNDTGGDLSGLAQADKAPEGQEAPAEGDAAIGGGAGAYDGAGPSHAGAYDGADPPHVGASHGTGG